MKYEVIVGNVGMVYTGESKKTALRIFREYVAQSRFLPPGYGRVNGEDVTILEDGEPIKEFFGALSQLEQKPVTRNQKPQTTHENLHSRNLTSNCPAIAGDRY